MIPDLSQENLGAREPTFDTERWKSQQILNLFMQNVDQLDAEGLAIMKPAMVQVLEWKPISKQP